MNQIFLNVGGRPGIDCGGFCRFCFFKKVSVREVDGVERGCVNCPPHKIGCDYCQNTITGVKTGFRPLSSLLEELQLKIMQNMVDFIGNDLRIVVHADADVFYYPHLMELVSAITETNLPFFLGYTSGKNIENLDFARELILQGLNELTVSVFSTNSEIRREWMRDKNPERSLEALKLFSENIKVNASVVVVPGVNDEDELLSTCSDLEEWGIKTLMLRRFGNFKEEGLIFNKHGPVSENVKTQTYDEFQHMVDIITRDFQFEVTSFPFYDREKDFPFAIGKKKYREHLENLPEIERESTIITGKLAQPFLEGIFELIDEDHMVNVVSVNKDIADLIVPEDLMSVDLSQIKDNVILPRGALVHQIQAQDILGKDGVSREVKRGPYNLTHPYYENLYFTQKQLLDYEVRSFKELIKVINL
jgi:methanogenesis marker radical SAM protein